MKVVRFRQPRVKDEAYLNQIRKLPCVVCLQGERSQAAHIRSASRSHGKRHTGMGEKPDDRWTVPLCARHHVSGPDSQHHHGDELKWWMARGIDPFELASELYENKGNQIAMLHVITTTYLGAEEQS